MSTYNGKSIKFDCQRCGHCCHTLLKEFEGLKTGLNLTPSEKVYFPNQLVSPLYGRGVDIDNIIKITTYQLNVDNCPHLKENNCMIYKSRPLGCKRFPLMFSLDTNTKIANGNDCKFIKEKEKELGEELNYLFTRSSFVINEAWSALETESGLFKNNLMDAKIEKMKVFNYNLKTMKWEKS